jgi:DNA helicase HerA-like ATPase
MNELGLGTPLGDAAGIVLGSEAAGPLEFWIGVGENQLVQLDDLVVVQSQAPGQGGVRFYGLVDQVSKRYEGAAFDSDAFRAAEGLLPTQVSYAAHVRVTRIDPEVFAPPHPGDSVRVVRGEDFNKALYLDRMERRIPIGLTRTGETVFANLEFLDGTRGAHASISGVSGVATKTSYATFLLYSLFHSGALGADAVNAKALIFNVKGEDLLWLDQANARLDDEQRQAYARLGLPAGPFGSVGLYAPVKRGGATPMPDTGTRQQGVAPYCWTLREFARDRLLRFAFAEAEDARSQIAFLIVRVERALEAAARQGDAADPGLDVAGVRCASFQELVDVMDTDALENMVAVNIASGTLDAFRRRLHAAAQHMGHLVRGDAAARDLGVHWENQQVSVVDLHNLHGTAQMFVVGVLLKRLMERKEQQGVARPLVFVVLDELNKYAPRSGWSPIQDVILDIAERGRSLGVSLFGAQQTASEVERRVIANAALKVVGRLDPAEAERGEYGFLSAVTRQRATMLSPGTMIVAQPRRNRISRRRSWYASRSPLGRRVPARPWPRRRATRLPGCRGTDAHRSHRGLARGPGLEGPQPPRRDGGGAGPRRRLHRAREHRPALACRRCLRDGFSAGGGGAAGLPLSAAHRGRGGADRGHRRQPR